MNVRPSVRALAAVLVLSTFLATTPGADAETYHLFTGPAPAPSARTLRTEAVGRLAGLAAAEAAAQAAPEAAARPSFGRLLREDLGRVFTSPARLHRRGWVATALAVGGLAAIMGSETGDVDAEGTEGGSFERHVAGTFEPLGAEASFAVLGAFALAGAVGHDRHATDVAVDGAISSLIAAGIIGPVLKESFGRHRPRDSASATDFKPFSGNASFPSGHTTQAFAIASVIATEYPRPWVEVASYGSATLVGYARVLHDRHYVSDVLAGALIGTLVGREVAHHNELRRSEHVAVLPLVGPHRSAGVAFRVGFGGHSPRG